MVEEGEEDFETGNSQYFRLGILKKKEGRKKEKEKEFMKAGTYQTINKMPSIADCIKGI
jgi:hypothetical protein